MARKQLPKAEINKNGDEVVRICRDSVDKPKKNADASNAKPKTEKNRRKKPAKASMRKTSLQSKKRG